TSNAILVLALVVTVQTICRAFAEPVFKNTSPSGLLLASAIISTLGLYLLSSMSGNSIFMAAIVFGIGVAYFWPTMLGFVSENIPESGAVGINLLGGAGSLAVSFFMFLMGGYYDRLIAGALPDGALLETYRSAESGTQEALTYLNAQLTAGPQVIRTTLIIPLILIVAFLFLHLYMRRKRNSIKTGDVNLRTT